MKVLFILLDVNTIENVRPSLCNDVGACHGHALNRFPCLPATATDGEHTDAVFLSLPSKL